MFSWASLEMAEGAKANGILVLHIRGAFKKYAEFYDFLKFFDTINLVFNVVSIKVDALLQVELPSFYTIFEVIC